MTDEFGKNLGQMVHNLSVPRIDHEAIYRSAQKTAGRMDAEIVFQHLCEEMAAFQKHLTSEEELGVILANYGVQAHINVRSITYRNPCIIEFSGLLDGQQKVKLIQHINQLNFLLVAVAPTEERPYRVGFGADI